VLLVVSLAGTQTAHAQLEPLEEGISVGAWTFYPSFALRVRGEYWRHSAEVGGDVFSPTAIQFDGFESAVPPVVRRDPVVDDLWLVSERARLGLRVEWRVLAAVLALQDARVLGVVPGALDVGNRSFGTFEPHEAYFEARTSVDDPLFRMRVGRQTVRWGDGRLIGDADWAPRGGAMDAARAMFAIGPVDLEALAVLLAPPGPIPPPYAPEPAEPPTVGTGSQLYGIDVSWRILPLLGVEITGLARVARDPLPLELARSDTFTVGGRVFGDFRGVVYAAEGHAQMGRVAGYAGTAAPIRDIGAFAVAGHVSWQTALPGKLRLAARGAYASGDDSNGQGEVFARFDPMVPTVHEHHGLMDLYAWSNLIEAGGNVGVRPVDLLSLEAGYTFVGLAQPNDRWSTAYLEPVGAAPLNESHVLGHEVDVVIGMEPWSFARFVAGYGLMVLGEGGSAILEAAGRGDEEFLHYVLAQAQLTAP
jgi:hypothetical protein